MTVAQTKKKKLLETQPFLTTLLDKNNCVGKEDSLEEYIVFLGDGSKFQQPLLQKMVMILSSS